MLKASVTFRVLAALPFATLALATTGLEAAPTHEITINIKKVKALDKADAFSKGDFFARVTINGEVQTTQHMRQSAEITPNWKLAAKVPPGEVKVKVEILDKDVSANDPIDINRVDAKRDLDFRVDTKKCRVLDFSSPYKCGQTIMRGGKEKKSAEISFTVGVKK